MNGKEFEILKPARKPLRMVLVGQPGFGKTTFATQAKESAIIMARGERGYETLLGESRVNAIPSVYIESWMELIGTLKTIQPGQFKTIAFDALGGFERLCHEYVCGYAFKGNWDSFENYGKGYGIALGDWENLMDELERISEKTNIILLGHTKVKTFNNPLGDNYDRLIVDMHEKTWSLIHKWADTVLFGVFRTIVNKDGKGVGGSERIIYTQHSDAIDAKNRFGLPEIIGISENYNSMYNDVMSHFTTKGE